MTEEPNAIPLWIRQISHQLIYDGSSWRTACPSKSVLLFEQFFTSTGIPHSSDPLCQGVLRFELQQSAVDSDPYDAEYLFRTQFQSFLLQRYGAMNPAHCDGHLRLLHKGITIPEDSTTIPWHISRESLFDYIPKERFSFSFADWPMLTFSLFGVRRQFGFNFVTHPEQVLCELQCADHNPDSYLAFRNHFEEAFGVPDFEFELSTHWVDEQIRITCNVSSSNPFVADAPHEFRFSIFNFLGFDYRRTKR